MKKTGKKVILIIIGVLIGALISGVLAGIFGLEEGFFRDFVLDSLPVIGGLLAWTVADKITSD